MWKKFWRSECEDFGWVKPTESPLLHIYHYFGCAVALKTAYEWPDYYEMYDDIELRESNLAFNLNGRLVRKEATIFEYHRCMVAARNDLKGIVEGYIPRSLKEFEVNLKLGEQPLPAIEAPSTSSPKDITKQVALGMNFVRIEPGSFLMGSPETEEDRGKDETQHRVTLTKPYYMAAHDVTRAQFAAFVDETGYKTDAEKAGSDETWKHNKVFEQEDTHPVVQVSWNDTVAFIAWLSKRDHKTYRLPTEAEWEYACRAGATTPFNTGATISADLANYNGSFVYGAGAKGVNREKTTPVGSFPANKWGLYDMHGNAWQWCSDVYGDYPASAVSDPSGPAEGPWRVLRGGSYVYAPLTCRSASRYHNVPEIHYNDCGFRVVLASP